MFTIERCKRCKKTYNKVNWPDCPFCTNVVNPLGNMPMKDRKDVRKDVRTRHDSTNIANARGMEHAHVH